MTIMETLKEAGFGEWQTGGGCVAMGKPLGGEVYMMVTDGGGMEMPTDSDWFIGVYDDGEHSEGVYFRPLDDPHAQAIGETFATFAEALAAATDKANELDMEQSAQRRGDL